jgi:hypothetical protein
MLKAIDTITGLVRMIFSVAALALLGYAGWTAYEFYYAKEVTLKQKERQIELLAQKLQEKDRQIERLKTAIKLLKVDHRIAQIAVVDQWREADTDRLMTRFRFVEVDQDGNPLEEPREFVIDGDVVYIDAWVAKFADEHIESGDDPLRSTSICLFRRIFGERQRPEDGFPLDPIGSRPIAYSRGTEMSEFEKQLWASFWDYANDPAKAAKAGLRAVHGEAPSIQLRKGMLYKILLRASDGLSIVPEKLPAAVASQPVM